MNKIEKIYIGIIMLILLIVIVIVPHDKITYIETNATYEYPIIKITKTSYRDFLAVYTYTVYYNYDGRLASMGADTADFRISNKSVVSRKEIITKYSNNSIACIFNKDCETTVYRDTIYINSTTFIEG